MRVPIRPVLLVSLLIATALGWGAAPVAAAQTWAPAKSATIHPGVQLFTKDAQCTANFIYVDGATVFIGQAAHCSGTGGNNESDGCLAPSLPLGTPVTVTGAKHPGTLVYNSWLTMQQLKEKNPDTCKYNDLALVRLDPADVGSVNPTVPIWGGPAGLDTAGTKPGEAVYSYGNSQLGLGTGAISQKQGTSQGDEGNGWSHVVSTDPPGVPGDSGSGFLDANGSALGILSTLEVAPRTGTNGVGDLARELDYMHQHSAFGAVQLVLGTEPFSARGR
ncbi:MAG TPA: trypsin-like peptidase domain-containing protein [Candidatus Dormibacteraeota bacterium]|nr:trypsin-like peptidase domain-containing protein [Candidatus Dormibacteraeota bacterium]